jgi:hypothetical protein
MLPKQQHEFSITDILKYSFSSYYIVTSSTQMSPQGVKNWFIRILRRFSFLPEQMKTNALHNVFLNFRENPSKKSFGSWNFNRQLERPFQNTKTKMSTKQIPKIQISKLDIFSRVFVSTASVDDSLSGHLRRKKNSPW